jgi:radical SAM-linked protein
MIKYAAKYSKKEMMVYISHLDLMNLFRRAMRRAALPIVLTGGFTPRVRISMPKAMKLGAEVEGEEMFFWLSEKKDEILVEALINTELPPGIRVFDVQPA